MNVLQFAPYVESVWKANLQNLTGYEPKYTFYSDFAIAEFMELFDNEKNAIDKTYKEVTKSWGDNYEALTEIVMVLNHKSWNYYCENENKKGLEPQVLNLSVDRGNEISRRYADLYEKCTDFFYKKFGKNEKAMDYFYEVTD